jgi:hypothetical protein
MSSKGRKALWIAAVIIALLSAALQIAVVASLWWNFDTRLSCDHMTYWDEWIDCMHGGSHQHIVIAEFSLATWALGGLIGTLARFATIYLSIVILAGLALAITWFLIFVWYESLMPRAAPTASLSDILNFARGAVLFFFYILGPAVAVWLFGLYKRTGRVPRLSTVFE